MQIYARKTNVMYTENETSNKKYCHKRVTQTSHKFKTFSLAALNVTTVFGTNSQQGQRSRLGKTISITSRKLQWDPRQTELNLYLS